jgi:hypothetical protein
MVPASVRRALNRIDVGEVNETWAELRTVSPDVLLSREKVVYEDTVSQYREELRRTGHFADPSGDPDTTYFPWGIEWGQNILIMDGTHRCQAQLEEGMPIKIHVFKPDDFGLKLNG